MSVGSSKTFHQLPSGKGLACTSGSLAWIHSAATGAGGWPYSGPTLSPFCSHWRGSGGDASGSADKKRAEHGKGEGALQAGSMGQRGSGVSEGRRNMLATVLRFCPLPPV